MSLQANPVAAQVPAAQAKVRPITARRWRVIHACEIARDLLPLVEGQVAVGMFPYIVTPHGAGSAELYLSNRPQEPAHPLSLLRSWQDVRNWRKSIMDCDPENSADLLHAHSFSSGMASVRSCSCVVYDLNDCIDQLALTSGQCGPGSWMGRSFRAAEQFILSRAAAVVVHSHGMKEAARERGAPAESIFMVPQPLSAEEEPRPQLDLNPGLEQPATLTFLAPQAEVHDKAITASLKLLEAFASAVRESQGVRLLLEAPAPIRSILLQSIGSLNLKDSVTLVDPADVASVWPSAQVVVAMGHAPGTPASRLGNDVCMNALRRGLALLAADVPHNREVSPDGRGCLWFDSNNPRDLAGRMIFLAGHADFRLTLARAGRTHLLETRSPAAIGRAYDEVYRYALTRKKSPGLGTGFSALSPATTCA